MCRDRFNALQVAKELQETPGHEHLRTALLASVELIPIIGGPLSTLLSQYLPQWKFRRVTQFLQDFAGDVETLKEKVDRNRAKTAEFGLLLEHVLLQVSRTSEEDQHKVKAYRAILLNTCLPSAPDKLERSYFLDLVNRLQEVHIIVLALFRDQYAFGKAHSSAPPPSLTTSSLKRTITGYLEPLEIAEELVDAAIRDLDTIGILPDVYDSLRTTMSAHGAIELSSRLKDFGRRFSDFISLPPQVKTAE